MGVDFGGVLSSISKDFAEDLQSVWEVCDPRSPAKTEQNPSETLMKPRRASAASEASGAFGTLRKLCDPKSFHTASA